MNKVLLLWLLMLPLAAQAVEPVPLKLDAAAERLLRQDLQIQSARLSVARAQAVLDEVQAAYLPKVELFSSLERNEDFDDFTGVNAGLTLPGTGQRFSVDVTRNTPLYNVETELSARYPLYTGGARPARVQAARDELRAVRAVLFQQQRDRLLELSERYWALVRAALEHQQAGQALQQAEFAVDIAERRLKLGRIAEVDLQEKRLESLQRRNEQTRSDIERQAAWQDYLSSLQLGSDQPYALDITELQQRLQNFDAHTVLRDYWNEDIPEIDEAGARLAASRAKVDISRADRLPQVDLVLSYNGTGRDDQSPKTALEDFAQSELIAAVELNWVLFDGGRSPRTRQARLDARIAALELQQQRQTFTAEQQGIIRDLRLLKADVELAGAELDLQQQRLEISRGRLERGEILDLDFRQAELQLQQSSTHWLLSRAALFEAQIGSLLRYGVLPD